jgi:hypothetical protein
MKFIYPDDLSEEQLKEAKRISDMIRSFHILRINGILSDSESKSSYKRLMTYSYKAGFVFNDIGFYEYEVKLRVENT